VSSQAAAQVKRLRRAKK